MDLCLGFMQISSKWVIGEVFFPTLDGFSNGKHKVFNAV